MVRYFRDLMESGTFRPVIDRRCPLEEIVEAYRYVETRAQDRQRRHRCRAAAGRRGGRPAPPSGPGQAPT
ncbi:zinc-binding dehydrogenase [Spirillospora sp. NPDC127200]